MDSKTKNRLKDYIKNGQTDLALTLLNTIDTRPTRTNKQSNSLHLWLNMIEREAENQGVTWDMLIRHTNQLRVTSEGLKSAVKQLIGVLWGYTSTTQIKKTGDLDVVIDHMTDWLSKEMEVPPFPSEELKNNELLESLKIAEKIDYPESEEPTI